MFPRIRISIFAWHIIFSLTAPSVLQTKRLFTYYQIIALTLAVFYTLTTRLIIMSHSEFDHSFMAPEQLLRQAGTASMLIMWASIALVSGSQLLAIVRISILFFLKLHHHFIQCFPSILFFHTSLSTTF
jgi:hypothetical protein